MHLALLWAGACRPDAATPEPVLDSDSDGDSDGDSGQTPVASALYPEAPFDCDGGLPPGPPAARRLSDAITATEDLAFAVDGALVAQDFETNIVGYAPDGAATVLSPNVGQGRAIDVLPDGDLALTLDYTGSLARMATGSGAVTPIALLPTIHPSGLDVTRDGWVAVGDLRGHVFLVGADDGEVVDLGLQTDLVEGYGYGWAYGTAFSPSETTLWLSAYRADGASLYASERAPSGTWSPPERVAILEREGAWLAGLATDACGGIWAIEPTDCTLWRFTDSGDQELVLDLRPTLDPERPWMCSNLAFGRGVGGWDAYRLYVTTYQEIVEVDVGIPGRPR